jgi:hypothetical protein
MNRKEMACAAVGAVLGAAGCSPGMKSLALPAANAEETSSILGAAAPVENTPHLTEVLLSLISGTQRDVSSVIFRLQPTSGWSISSDDPRLQVAIERGHVAVLTAPETEKVHFLATATISHPNATPLLVRCHVEANCT